MQNPTFMEDIPWNTVLTLVVLLWTVGSLAFIERLRRTFATPRELDNLENRLCDEIEKLKKTVDQFQAEVKGWEREMHATTATKAEVKHQIDGFGSKVNNLEHMFTSVHQIADEAKERSKDAQSEIRHLGDKVTRVETQNTEIARKLDLLTEFVAEVRAYMRRTVGQ